ncbi:MAG: prepilin-type N-terminal cleavage/methylation domain-containing protein [Opitutales bacterium]|jgi:prepilin-type N-terminal cleavage/methylation domain-containing protein
MSRSSQAARRGFTLVELLLVITIILLISTLFLGLSTGDGGGLPAGQRALASSIRTVRAMALMNRGPATGGVSYAARYRLLILNDPDDEANHLRQFVIAVGGVSAAELAGADPATITNTTAAPYRWFSPEPPQSLPTGVIFVPPASEASTTMTLAVTSGTRRSNIGQLADNVSGTAKDSPFSSPPWMMYAPTAQPMALADIGADMNPKKWFYVELQAGSGSSNHLGRVLLVLAKGIARSTGTGSAAIDVASENQFAALSLRPNGDVTMTLDADEMDKAK